MHCGDQRHLGLCLGYVPALAYGSCRVSDQGTTLRASDLHNARATILNPFNTELMVYVTLIVYAQIGRWNVMYCIWHVAFIIASRDVTTNCPSCFSFSYHVHGSMIWDRWLYSWNIWTFWMKAETFCFLGWNIPEYHGQYHCWWCLGSMQHQATSSKGINYAG